MGIKLSILVPSVHTRRNTFLPKALDMLYDQYEELDESQKKQVEILFLVDNKTIMLGHKRNTMVDMASGDYVVHVDDDDRVEPNYIKALLAATDSKADVITFLASVSINGATPKICRYSITFDSDHNTPTQYNRLPNHICCVRRELARQISFPNIRYGEDSAYSKLLKPLVKKEYAIDEVLYHYDFNVWTTETQEHLRGNKPVVRRDIPAIVDVVILSNSKDESYRKMTQKTIDTCLMGANGLQVNIMVVEQAEGVLHKNAKTIFHNAPFEYNKFMNLGAREGVAPWIMFANNDLIFTDGWLHELLIPNHPVVSPHEPRDLRQRKLSGNETGYVNGRHLSGWVYMMKRSTWEEIGGLDEDFAGWYADDVVIEQVRAIGIAPMVVKNSIVKHLGSRTLSRLPQEERDELCWGQLELFNRKYNQNKFHDNPNYQDYLRRKANK